MNDSMLPSGIHIAAGLATQDMLTNLFLFLLFIQADVAALLVKTACCVMVQDSQMPSCQHLTLWLLLDLVLS